MKFKMASTTILNLLLLSIMVTSNSSRYTSAKLHNYISISN